NQHVTMSFQATVDSSAEPGATLATSATLLDVDGVAAATTSLSVQSADAAETTDSTDTTADSTDETTESDAPTSETDATTETTDSGAPAAPETAAVSFSAVNADGDLLAGAAFTITGSDGTVFCVSDNSKSGAAGCDSATAVADDDPADGAFLV